MSFTPDLLFAGGVPGVWFDPSDLSTLFSDASGTAPATVGGPVGMMRDKSGHGLHAVQADPTKKPVLRQSGSLYYLEFNGSTSAMATPSMDLSATAHAVAFSGYRKTANGFGCKFEFSDAYDGHTGTLTEYIDENGGTFSEMAQFGHQVQYGLTGLAKNTDYVTSCEYDLTTGNGAAQGLVPLVNHATPALTLNNDGPLVGSNFGNYPLYIGARAATGINGEFHLYGLAIVGSHVAPTDLWRMEYWLAQRSGATIPSPPPENKVNPNSVHPTPVVGMDPTTGALFALGGAGGSTVDREIIQDEYVATAAGTGYSIGDMVVRADIYDVSGTPTFVATIWRNVSTGLALGTAPTITDLKFVGTKDAATETSLAALNAKIPAKGQAAAAGSVPVVLSSDGPFATNFGVTSDSAATTDTGTFSFMAFVKRLMQKLPNIGAQAKAASMSVTLATDQGNVSVADGQATPTYVGSGIAATGTVGTLLSASAGRRRFIATNPKASTAAVGLSVKSDATFAQCEIILAAGESWVEALAAAAAWYVVTETGSITVPVQTAS